LTNEIKDVVRNIAVSPACCFLTKHLPQIVKFSRKAQFRLRKPHRRHRPFLETAVPVFDRIGDGILENFQREDPVIRQLVKDKISFDFGNAKLIMLKRTTPVGGGDGVWADVTL
jgi:hypothetical protein